MTEPCPGSCNAWWRNLTPEQQEDSDAQPRQGEPVWCDSCKARIRWQLAALDYAAAMLAFRADGWHEQPESPARANGHHPSPSQTGDDLQELVAWLLDWEDAARKEMGLGASFRHGYLATVQSEVIAWLAMHLTRILELPFAQDFGEEVGRWHRELLAKNKAQPPRKALLNCPRCERKLLYWLDGRDGLMCAGCHRPMSEDEYRAEADATRRHLEQAG